MYMKHKLRFLLIAAIAMIGTATYAKTTTYNGSTWNNGVPAGSSDIVTITGGSYSLPANITYASLTLNGGNFNTNGRSFSVTDVTLTSGTFTTAANQTFSGTLTMNGGSYTLGNTTRTLTVGNMIVQSGTLSLPCALTVNTTLTLNGGSFDVNGRTFSGNNLFLTSGTFTAAASTSFSGTVTMNGGSYTLGSNTRTLTAGNLIVQTGTLTLPCHLTVNTTLTLNGGSLDVNGRTFSAANLALTSGTFTTAASTSFSGTVTLNGGNYTLGSSTRTLTAANVLVQSGTFSLPSNMTVNTTFTLNGGSMNVNSRTLTVDNVTLTSGTLSLGGTVVNPSGNLIMGGGTFSLGGAAISVGGNLSVTGNSTISSSGLSRLDATGSLLTINGGTLLLDNVEVVIDDLTFSSNHNINASNGGFLAFDNSSQHQINGSNPGFATNNAHVNAKVRLYTKNTNTGLFNFPIGDGTVFSPYIFTPTTVSGSTAFGQWIEATYVGSIAPNKTLDLSTPIVSASGYEYWIVAKSGSNVAGTMALRYDNNSSKTGKTVVNSLSNINADLIVAQYNTSNSKWAGLTTTTTTASNISTASVTGATLNTMYTLASDNARTSFIVPLPVVLLEFNAATTQNKSVNITWSTAKEEYSNYFEVMRSTDGFNWKSIGIVQSTGASTEISKYSLTDYQPYSLNYYRLKEVAMNGDFSYSDIRIAKVSGLASKISFFPNPANQTLNVSCANLDFSNEVNIQLVNQMGQVVLVNKVDNMFATSFLTSVNVAELPAGIYQVIISNAGEEISEKLIINH